MVLMMILVGGWNECAGFLLRLVLVCGLDGDELMGMGLGWMELLKIDVDPLLKLMWSWNACFVLHTIDSVFQ